MKKLLVFLLALTLILSLASCGGGCTHADEDKDGVCDKCKEAMEYKVKNVDLIDEDGLALFQIVLANDIDSSVRLAVQELVLDLEDVDIEVEIVDDNEETIEDCEVLIGNVKSRGEIYSLDGYSYGNKGYGIKIVDGKILINGGSPSALNEALDIFIEDILTFDGDEIWDITMGANQQVEEIQSDYSITSLKLLGNDMKGYTIAVDKKNNVYHNAAKNMQDVIYKRTGYFFEIVDITNVSDKSVVLKNVPKVYGEDSFKISASGTQLLIECAFENKLSDTLSAFLTTTFVQGDGDINFEGTLFKKDISFVTYEEFGATSNGDKDNDFEAIYKAHVFANDCGQKVIISGSPTYYITYPIVGNSYVSVPIKTDTSWGNATIVIDDSVIDLHGNGKYTHDDFKKMSSIAIFKVEPTEDNVTIYANKLPEITLNKTSTKLDLGLGYDALLRTCYEGHRVYRRKGYPNGGYHGGYQGEIILIDAEGNIDETTPVMWDYAGLTYVVVHKVDTEPLTIEGGTVKTIACNEHMLSPDGITRDYYYSRGLQLSRSNTTVKNVKHYVEGEITLKEQVEEGKLGVAYNGFFAANFATFVTLKDCVLSGRRCYTKTYEVVGSGTTGTYDFSAAYVNKIVLDGCIQHNFWVTVNDNGELVDATADTPNSFVSMARAPGYKHPNYSYDVLTCWGIGGTNWCKNMEYINSTLSRFDAHMGLYNGKVIGSTVNILALTGAGEMIIEDTTMYSLDPSSTYNTILHLRGDYGSTWDGDILIKDFNAYLYKEAPFVVMSSYSNWYFGYQCAFPSIEMDNVTFYDAEEFYATKTREAYEEGDTVYLYTGSHIENEPQIHLDTLSTSTYPPNYSYKDYDGDGFVDDYDMNGDGVVGEGDMVYDKALENDNTDGIPDSNSRKNLNPLKPPKYIKVFNNTGIVIKLNRTDDDGVAEGGFFGKTEFYYAPDKFYVGTPEENNADDDVFYFQAG